MSFDGSIGEFAIGDSGAALAVVATGVGHAISELPISDSVDETVLTAAFPSTHDGTYKGIIHLFQLDLARLGGPIYYFTGAATMTRPIVWGGNLYVGMYIEASGFEMTTKGTLPQPNLVISNLYGAANLLLSEYRGLIGAQVTRYRTMERFLDDGETPDPNAYLSKDVFRIAQKTSHTPMQIVFKLATPLDQEGVLLPKRQVLRDVCNHTYRRPLPDGSYDYTNVTCPYVGVPTFDTRNRPSVHMEDSCSRNHKGCSLRFPNVPLPGRFFPGVGRIK